MKVEARPATVRGNAALVGQLIDVVWNAAAIGQVRARSSGLRAMIQRLCRFQQSALGSAAELAATETLKLKLSQAKRGKGSGLYALGGGAATSGGGAGRQVAAKECCAGARAGDPGHPERRQQAEGPRARENRGRRYKKRGGGVSRLLPAHCRRARRS